MDVGTGVGVEVGTGVGVEVGTGVGTGVGVGVGTGVEVGTGVGTGVGVGVGTGVEVGTGVGTGVGVGVGTGVEVGTGVGVGVGGNAPIAPVSFSPSRLSSTASEVEESETVGSEVEAFSNTIARSTTEISIASFSNRSDGDRLVSNPRRLNHPNTTP
ncbi:hypothetical protein CKA32_001292 [Geitlerinema sp. FC II]|nr:hypothetical protein CKA32_001292 [Geitlerinema sp. FC II]